MKKKKVTRSALFSRRVVPRGVTPRRAARACGGNLWRNLWNKKTMELMSMLSTKELLRLENKKKVEHDLALKAQQKVANEKFKEGNAALLELHQQAVEKQQAEDKYYAMLALKEMDRRDVERKAFVQKRQDKLAEMMKNADLEKRPRPLKRWMVRKSLGGESSSPAAESGLLGARRTTLSGLLRASRAAVAPVVAGREGDRAQLYGAGGGAGHEGRGGHEESGGAEHGPAPCARHATQ
eukprot:1194421-Prorocentrum_minimum.AAC.1